LVAFGDGQINGPSSLHEVARGVGLGVERGGGDERACERHLAKQLREQRDFVGFFVHRDLRDDALAPEAERAEEVRAALLALGGFAVDGDLRMDRVEAEEPLAEEFVEERSRRG